MQFQHFDLREKCLQSMRQNEFGTEISEYEEASIYLGMLDKTLINNAWVIFTGNANAG